MVFVVELNHGYYMTLLITVLSLCITFITTDTLASINHRHTKFMTNWSIMNCFQGMQNSPKTLLYTCNGPRLLHCRGEAAAVILPLRWFYCQQNTHTSNYWILSHISSIMKSTKCYQWYSWFVIHFSFIFCMFSDKSEYTIYMNIA